MQKKGVPPWIGIFIFSKVVFQKIQKRGVSLTKNKLSVLSAEYVFTINKVIMNNGQNSSSIIYIKLYIYITRLFDAFVRYEFFALFFCDFFREKKTCPR